MKEKEHYLIEERVVMDKRRNIEILVGAERAVFEYVRRVYPDKVHFECRKISKKAAEMYGIKEHYL